MSVTLPQLAPPQSPRSCTLSSGDVALFATMWLQLARSLAPFRSGEGTNKSARWCLPEDDLAIYSMWPLSEIKVFEDGGSNAVSKNSLYTHTFFFSLSRKSTP